MLKTYYEQVKTYYLQAIGYSYSLARIVYGEQGGAGGTSGFGLWPGVCIGLVLILYSTTGYRKKVRLGLLILINRLKLVSGQSCLFALKGVRAFFQRGASWQL